MKDSIQRLLKGTLEKINTYKPVVYKFSEKDAPANFDALLASGQVVSASDSIYEQLRELMKHRHPDVKLTEERYRELIDIHLDGRSQEEYGAWVFYPWSGRLVHVLDEAEYKEVRTAANKYKITHDEQELLATRKIGVVGLSVGQSVSLTMAMERGFGELRIADFDLLELGNMNRIRSGVHNIQVPKVVIVAREIAEIDPYLNVTVFDDGLHAGNMDRFFNEGGKLDLVIDECDSFDVKIRLRYQARSLGIPVLMEASDRGMLDVERYDLDPTLPILHGLVEHLDPDKLSVMTNEEKTPFMLSVLGVDTITKRLKASMVEIGQTLATWPQLASSVTLGGAVCADVCRRVLLGYYRESGRYFVDIESLVKDRDHKMEGRYDTVDYDHPGLSAEELRQVASECPAPHGSPVTADVLEELVTAALYAPSAGNNQPWKWLSKDGALYLFYDKKQSASWFDSEDFISQIGLGAALESIVVKAGSLGLDTVYKLFPLAGDRRLVAVFSFTPSSAHHGVEKVLAPYLQQRCANRKKGSGEAIDDAVLAALAGNAGYGSELSFVTGREQIEAIADIVAEAEKLRFLHPQAHHDFYTKEIRWNDSGNELIHEGLDVRTLELSPLDETGLRVAADPAVIALLNQWGGGKAFEKLSRGAVRSSSAIGLLTMPGATPDDFILGGASLQRVWLAATQHQLAVHPVSAPLFLHAKTGLSNDHGLESVQLGRIQELYDRLKSIFAALALKQGVFLFRLSKADAPSARSLRKSISELYLAF